MTKWTLVAAAAIGFAGSASAAVITLEAVTNNGANDNIFSYHATLGPDEGLRSGDRFVIFDFVGYIAGSIFSPSPNLIASVEFSSPANQQTPGATDDAAVANLVFTYVGPEFRTSGGPLAAFDFDGLGARSTFSGVGVDSMFTLTTKNNPTGPGGAGTPIFTYGSVAVPAAIPEPAAWAMMLGGFGMVGAFARRRTQMRHIIA